MNKQTLVLILCTASLTLSGCISGGSSSKKEDDPKEEVREKVVAPTELNPATGETKFTILSDDHDRVVIDADNGTFTWVHNEHPNQTTITGTYDPLTGTLDPTPGNPGDEFSFTYVHTAPLTTGYQSYIAGQNDIVSGFTEDTIIVMPYDFEIMSGGSRNNVVSYNGDVAYMDNLLNNNQVYMVPGNTEVDFGSGTATTEFDMVTSNNQNILYKDWELGLATNQSNETGKLYVDGKQATDQSGWVTGDVISATGSTNDEELVMNFSLNSDKEKVNISGSHIAK